MPFGPTGQENKISFLEYDVIFTFYRIKLLRQVKETAGYIPSEVEQLRMSFSKYDKNGNDQVEGVELRTLIAETIPESTRSKEDQMEIIQLLQEVGSSSDLGGLSFTQFLWLNRKCHDKRDERDVSLEAGVLRDCNFSPEEVEGYRQVFSADVGWGGELGFSALLLILTRFHTLTAQQSQELRHIVVDLSPYNRETIRFPQFLRLMDMFENQNLMGVNDAAVKTVHQTAKVAEIRARLDPRGSIWGDGTCSQGSCRSLSKERGNMSKELEEALASRDTLRFSLLDF
jgi:Ca2+-binding EF-hand superfamily protein